MYKFAQVRVKARFQAQVARNLHTSEPSASEWKEQERAGCGKLEVSALEERGRRQENREELKKIGKERTIIRQYCNRACPVI